MAETIPKPQRKSTFRRVDKYLYVASTMQAPPAYVIAVCVLANSGRHRRAIARELDLSLILVDKILLAADPFLRKRKVKS